MQICFTHTTDCAHTLYIIHTYMFKLHKCMHKFVYASVSVCVIIIHKPRYKMCTIAVEKFLPIHIEISEKRVRENYCYYVGLY